MGCDVDPHIEIICLQKVLRRETTRKVIDGSAFFEKAKQLEQRKRGAKKMA